MMYSIGKDSSAMLHLARKAFYPEGLAAGVRPFTHGSNHHTDVMKAQALKQALDARGFDVVFGGARRDEEKSRAKERVFSFRAPVRR
jgi:sulfate adenylyltransferase subunit 2